MEELTAEATLENLSSQGIETIIPEQPIMMACGLMGDPSGNDIIAVDNAEPSISANLDSNFKLPECT